MSAENPQEQPSTAEQTVGRVPIRALFHEKFSTAAIFVGSFVTFELVDQRAYVGAAVVGMCTGLNMKSGYQRLSAHAPQLAREQEVDTPE